MTVLIATLPKSGTWYIQLVLAAYKYGTVDMLIKDSMVPWCGKIQGNDYMVGHAEGTPQGDYCLDGYTWANKMIYKPKATFYIYRNPIDHFMSYHRHLKTHTGKPERKLGALHVEEFIFNHALPSYIKHIKSHKDSMKIRYEDLISEPEYYFKNIINRIVGNQDIDVKALLRAIQLCSKENLSTIENKYDIALAGDQNEGERHIRNGGSYDVPDELRDEILESCNKAMNRV